jgi:hypothetical protein
VAGQLAGKVPVIELMNEEPVLQQRSE